MDLRGNFSKCLSENANVSQNPPDACYMLTFNTAEDDILPRGGDEIDLTFDIYIVRAKITAPSDTTKIINTILGNKVTSVHQLGSIMGLKHGDLVLLRKEQEGRYSLHPV
jgi:hypothetical protein